MYRLWLGIDVDNTELNQPHMFINCDAGRFWIGCFTRLRVPKLFDKGFIRIIYLSISSLMSPRHGVGIKTRVKKELLSLHTYEIGYEVHNR